MDISAQIRDTILQQLRQKGLKQKDLAEAIGVPVSTLNSWLKRNRDVPAQYIIGIATFLDCEPLSLLMGAPEKQADDMLCGINADTITVAHLWERLDAAGKAIILGEIYRRLEAIPKEDDFKADKLS